MNLSKNNVAVFIALLFHVSGCIGILFTPYKNWFIQNTPLNLLLMVALIVYTQEQKNKAFFLFAIIAFCTGMITEIIGVNTGKLFGSYSYGTVMGYKIYHVPLLIGVQWFVTVFCSGVMMHMAYDWMYSKYSNEKTLTLHWLSIAALAFDGALLATFFDFIMEPVAVKLGFWQWEGGVIPNFNYLCWFLISFALLIVFALMPFNKRNIFAVHLFIIQILFFLALRNLL